jgi:hypothetical protein
MRGGQEVSRLRDQEANAQTFQDFGVRAGRNSLRYHLAIRALPKRLTGP